MSEAQHTKETRDIQCNCFNCGPARYEFTQKEIDKMRSKLAQQWKQSVSQVMDYEAVHYLRQRSKR
jgi:hypothetical protein